MDKPAIVRTILSLAVSRSWLIHLVDVTFPIRFSMIILLDFLTLNFWIMCVGSERLCAVFTRPHALGTSTLLINMKDLAYLLLYVDDIILPASTPYVLSSFISGLNPEFNMKDLGLLHHFLGLTATCSKDGLFRSQSTNIFRRANMCACNPFRTPTDSKEKLSAATGPSVFDPTLYRSIAAALQYLTFTRPDIS